MNNIHFKCEQCDTFFVTEVLYQDHRKDQHAPVAIDTNEEEDGLKHENSKLKKGNQFLKNRFEQAQTSFNDLEKEIEDVRKPYAEELAETRNEYEKVKRSEEKAMTY